MAPTDKMHRSAAIDSTIPLSIRLSAVFRWHWWGAASRKIARGHHLTERDVLFQRLWYEVREHNLKRVSIVGTNAYWTSGNLLIGVARDTGPPRQKRRAEIELVGDVSKFVSLACRLPPLATLRDAVQYMTSLPRDEQPPSTGGPPQRFWVSLGNGGCVVFARIAVIYGLRKGVQEPRPEADPTKKTTHWGRRRLKRDR
jgi:hypothetical protein